MQWTDNVAYAPGVPAEHAGDPQYEQDYWEAYNEAWTLALACAGDAFADAAGMDWSRQQAHQIALGFADVRRQLRE